MFNKLKKAVKYIVKKIKRGVEISKELVNQVSEVGKEVVSGTKDVVNTVGTTAINRYADYMDKKLDMVEHAGSALCNGVKTIRTDIHSMLKTPTYIKNLGVVLLFASAGLITVGLTNKEVK